MRALFTSDASSLMGSRRSNGKCLFLDINLESTWRCEAPGKNRRGRRKAVGVGAAGGHARPRLTRVWRSRVLGGPATACSAEPKK